MRVAFVSQLDPRDRTAFSGSSYQILQLVLSTGATVEVVGPIVKKWKYHAMRLASIPVRFSGRGMAWPKHPFLLRGYAREVDAAVRRLDPDLVFSPGTNVIAYSSFLKPTVFWSDAPFAGLVDYYPWAQYQNLTESSRRDGFAADNRALRFSTAGIYRSSWARDCAIHRHEGDPSRLHVLPLPGNLARRWTLPEIQKAVPRRIENPWKILFSGFDWKRKGGDRTVAIVNELVRLGQPCELCVVGGEVPEKSAAAARFPLHRLGHYNLNDAAKRKDLGDLLDESTFLLVPSTAEALGLVYCEALSAGVPSVGTNTGGVPDVIMDGRTGLLLDPNESAAAAAQRMLEAGRTDRYSRMAEECWQQWTARFSAEVIRTKLAKILENAVGASSEVRDRKRVFVPAGE